MFNKIQQNIKKQALNPTEMDVLSEQYKLIEDSLSIIKKQLSDIDYIGNNESEKEKADEDRRSELLNTKKRYLDFFYQVSGFLLKKAKTEDRGDMRFYLPNVRTLVDIYSKLLYLATQETDKQMMTCIYERLYFLKKLNSKFRFNENRLCYKTFLDSRGYSVPNYEEFSKKSIQRDKINNYFFPATEQIVTNKNISKFKPACFKKDLNIAEKVYKIYRGFSEYIHGNMLTKDSFGNEDLWVVRNILFLSALIMVLIDKDILNNKNELAIDRWSRNLSDKDKKFCLFYDKKRSRK